MIKKSTTEARPSPKNEVWEQEIEGQKYICERPYYFIKKLERELYSKCFENESQLIYGKKLPFFFDEEGRWWAHPLLCSQAMLQYFIEHPSEYIRIISHKTQAVKRLIGTWRELLTKIEKKDPETLRINFEKLCKCFIDFYSYHFITYIVFDEIVLKFNKVLEHFLSKKERNSYLTEFLQAEITKEAIKVGAIGETTSLDRSIYYSKSQPLIFYREPKLFFDSVQDRVIIEKLYQHHTDLQLLKEFFSLRLIMPISIQISEEGQYLETKSFLPLFRITLQNIESLFKEQGLYHDDVRNLSKDEILSKLQKIRSYDLKGMGVSKGIVQGKVHIIKDPENIHFDEGDILVTKITDPTMVPIMNKAGGIICDIGGLTSHPSIVSRELGIPCIVSAKHSDGRAATQVLKEGIHIEMNGSTGEIKIFMNHADEFVKSTIAALGEMDLGTIQPFGILEYEGLIAVPWIKKVQFLIKTSKEKGITHQELSSLFPTMGSLRCHIFFSMLNMKCARLPKVERKEIFDFLFKMVELRAVEDVYGFSSNVVKTKEQVEKLFTDLSFQKGTPSVAKLLGKIYNACYNLSAGLYLDFYLDYCHEHEGPYDVSQIYGPGHILVIKRFTEMQPIIWPEVRAPVNELLICCVYKDVKFTCDMVSCHSVYEGDTINNLVAYTVIGDGKPMYDETSLTVVLQQMSDLSVWQWKRLNAMSQEEQKVKGILIKSYGWRKLFEKAGLPWEPSEEMKQIAKGPLTDQTFWNIPKENQKEFFYRLYHPEFDFYPGDSLEIKWL